MKTPFVAALVAPVVLLASTTHAVAKHSLKTGPPAAHTSEKSTSSSSKSNHSRSHKSRYAAVKRPPKPSFQTHPSSDRYQQIQQALADKGYYKGAVDGTWNDDSVDALKRFQADNKLDNDGKINSLSLIQLGLGPKHDGSSITTVTPGLPEAPPPVREAKPEEQQLTQ